MELFWILLIVFAFVMAKNVFDQRAKQRADSLRLLEEALKNPSVDRNLIETLTAQFTGQRPFRPGSAMRSGLGVFAGLGWIAMMAGIGIAIAGEASRDRDAFAGGMVTAAIGFGLVTYPFVMRELARRDQA
jgi:hypothetical protein